MRGGITEIVKHLLIINVLMYIITNSPVVRMLPDLVLYFPSDTRFSPYQIVSHMFMHGSTGHLIFNMMSLFFFGPIVEKTISSQRFFILYFAAAMGAIIAHFGVQYFQYTNMGITHFPGVVGASGAIMGVVIAFATLYPNMTVQLIIPPIPLKAKYMAIGFVALDLFSGVTGAQAGVANWAHLGGALVGFLLTIFWFKRGNSRL